MEINELRAEANKLGFSIAKKIVYEKLSQCRCGSKRIESRYGFRYAKIYYCTKCGYAGKPAKYKYQAIINWNNAVNDADAYKQHSLAEMAKLLGIDKTINSEEELLVEVRRKNENTNL